MIHIRQGVEPDSELLALLGRITYSESHGQFIADKKDLLGYNEEAFSVSAIQTQLKDPNIIYYLLYHKDLPIGYAKLVLAAHNEYLYSQNCCLLERIYILNDFIPLKLGRQFLMFLEQKVRELKFEVLWLSVYLKNHRAIRFYKKNGYQISGNTTFWVNAKAYENYIFSKSI